jgi:ketosteroid isomerase-like protein
VPSANLELVRSIYAAWERGDFSSTDWADPEIEMVGVSELLPSRVTGIAQLARSWSESINAYGHYTVEAEDFLEIDGERVLVLAEQRGHGKASGIPVSRKGANVFHVRNGKVVKLLLYEDRGPAFADLGLSPDGARSSS